MRIPCDLFTSLFCDVTIYQYNTIMSADLQKKLIWSLMFGLLVYVAFALFSDARALSATLSGWPWLWLPAVVGLTLVNYLLRLLKWHWYLHLLEVPIGFRDSARIFGVGMLMVMTPGKAGEFLKSYMVKKVTGTPMIVTAPAVLAERVTDGIAMLLLASVGLYLFPSMAARGVAITASVGFLAFIVIMQIRPLALWFLAFGERIPGVRKFAGMFRQFYESSYTIFRLRNLLISIGIGIVSWASEGLAYFVVLAGFGVEVTVQNVGIAIFIFCISVVIGAVVASPGGLGGVEAGLAGFSIQILKLSTTTATAAALLIRFCTLWFGVLIGVVSFFFWPDLLAGAENAQREQQMASVESTAGD